MTRPFIPPCPGCGRPNVGGYSTIGAAFVPKPGCIGICDFCCCVFELLEGGGARRLADLSELDAESRATIEKAQRAIRLAHLLCDRKN